MPRRLAGQDSAIIATAQTQNPKLGNAASTIAPLSSCGPCPLRDNGCYAQQGPLGWMVKRMDRHVADNALSALEMAQAEADAIDNLPGPLPLRLHVAGDCATPEAAQTVSSAAARYSERHSAPTWTYTHAWRAVPRASWQTVSVLASCETPDQTADAMRSGYAAALVVAEYPNGKRSWKLPTGATAIPCPQTTGAAQSCTDCRLCLDDTRLRARGAVIAFAVHGAQAKRARTALTVIAKI